MKHLKNQRGGALVVTIVLLMIVSILGLAMLASVSREVKLNKAVEESTITKYLAQAGINHGLYLVENDNGSMIYPYSKEVVLGDRTRIYVITISKSGTLVIIDSIGKIEENGTVKRQVALKATIDEAGNVTVQQ